MSTEVDLLQHLLATLAYRTQKVLRDAPQSFASFQVGQGVRTPHEILAHMRGVLTFALGLYEGKPSDHVPEDDFGNEVIRFFRVLDELSNKLAEAGIPPATDAKRLLQGPFADAMTHAGQLAMLRRLDGLPVPPENFHEADI
jgi:hypothetical protein